MSNKKRYSLTSALEVILIVGIALLLLTMLALGARPLFQSETNKTKRSPASIQAPALIVKPTSNVEPTLSKVVEPKKAAKLPILVLGSANSIVFREVVTEESVTNVMLKMQKLSDSLSHSDTIYLVLDTPGGSIAAGNRFISFVKALPQQVKTLTLFSASMGFHFAQSFGERMILDSGTTMSHRASFSGFSGEVPGEFLVKLNYWLKILERMDLQAAGRMQLTLKDYQTLIADEMWLEGADAVAKKAMDTAVLARCDASLTGTEDFTVSTMFGPFTVTVSNCPLVPGYLAVKRATDGNEEYGRLMFSDKAAFVNKYIKNNEWLKYQK